MGRKTRTTLPTKPSPIEWEDEQTAEELKDKQGKQANYYNQMAKKLEHILPGIVCESNRKVMHQMNGKWPLSSKK